MLIGEAPGEIEDSLGLSFQGEIGSLLNKMLLAININRTKYTLPIQLILDHPVIENQQAKKLNVTHFFKRSYFYNKSKNCYLYGQHSNACYYWIEQ